MDTMILSMGTQSDVLSEELNTSSIPTLVIGDAREPRRAVEAIAEGSEIARTM
jgi:hypothetical protein